MKFLKWLAVGSAMLNGVFFGVAFRLIDQPILAFCATGVFAALATHFLYWLPKTSHYRQLEQDQSTDAN